MTTLRVRFISTSVDPVIRRNYHTEIQMIGHGKSTSILTASAPQVLFNHFGSSSEPVILFGYLLSREGEIRGEQMSIFMMS
jgi:hypothetical protein